MIARHNSAAYAVKSDRSVPDSHVPDATIYNQTPQGRCLSDSPVHQSSVQQPSVHQPSVHQSSAHQPSVHQPSAYQPSAHQFPAMNQPVSRPTDKSRTENRPISHEEQEKLSQLYHVYYQTLWYTALGYLKDPQLAEDMVQETFIKASEHLSAMEEIHSKMTKYFLVTITRNKCIDYIRKKRRTPETLTESQEYLPEYDNLPLDHVIRQETLDELSLIMSSLDDSYRVPLELRYISGLTNVEISRRTGLSVNLVAVRISRAKKILKSRMKSTYF